MRANCPKGQSHYSGLLTRAEVLIKLITMDKHIIEKNKAIAEFMGIMDTPFGLHDGGSHFKHLLEEHITIIDDPLQFHSSWDWLKPVINKIIVDNNSKVIEECSRDERFYLTRVAQMPIYTDISVAHEYVSEYIRWFNNNKS